MSISIYYFPSRVLLLFYNISYIFPLLLYLIVLIAPSQITRAVPATFLQIQRPHVNQITRGGTCSATLAHHFTVAGQQFSIKMFLYCRIVKLNVHFKACFLFFLSCVLFFVGMIIFVVKCYGIMYIYFRHRCISKRLS